MILPLAEISILINLYFRAVKLKSAQKLIRSFSFLYLIRYPFLIFAFLIPEPIRMFSVVLILNAIPVFWIKLYVDKAEIVSFNHEKRNEAIEKITTDYKISTRETEILKLVLNGKNNKQIEQELFISYHTVKNHIYNIFQKLGISNRYQLISLISNQERLGKVEVVAGLKDRIPVLPNRPLTLLLKKGMLEKLKVNLEMRRYVEAPVERMQEVGTLRVKLGNEILETVPVVAAESVPRKSFFQKIMDWVKGIFSPLNILHNSNQ